MPASESARAKAVKEAPEVEFVDPVWHVRTKAGAVYVVHLYDYYATCTCPNGQRRGNAACYHVAAAELKREAMIS